jgi:hypothetical protein
MPIGLIKSLYSIVVGIESAEYFNTMNIIALLRICENVIFLSIPIFLDINENETPMIYRPWPHPKVSAKKFGPLILSDGRAIVVTSTLLGVFIY